MKHTILLSAQLAALTFSAAGQSIDCDTLLTKELEQITTRPNFDAVAIDYTLVIFRKLRNFVPSRVTK
ncbi:MAG: hypothetical protein K2N28_02370 [Muribaculaceae bacterium]|nr:hypothetical protein [Muribaculaceae bacterium]